MTSSIKASGSTALLATQYKYTPLAFSSTQFRIFTLLPSPNKDASLEGTLRIEAFQAGDGATCPYEALSYVWGEELDAFPLLIVGKGYKRITKNLAEALRHIRLASEPRELWVDALCIYQTHTPERIIKFGRCVALSHRRLASSSGSAWQMKIAIML